MTDDMMEETAGLHVLGVFDEPERAAIARRMEQDPALRAAVAIWSRRLEPMLDATPALAPPPSVWAAIQSRIAQTRQPTRRHNEGTWITLAPGATMRFLHVAPVTGARSAILRMEPGSEVPEHDHDDLEECFVVDGTVIIDDERYQPGDHVLGVAGSRHQSIKAVTSVTLLLHWSATPA